MSLNSTRVSYEGAQVLKATCNFSYDRYIAGETTSFSFDKGTALNNADYNLQKSQFTSNFGSLNKNLYSPSTSGNTTGTVSPTGQVNVQNNNASSANPLTGTEAMNYLIDQGMNKTVIEGINDMEAGRNRD